MTQAAPFIGCPHCGKEFELSDYYDVVVDDEDECPSCGTTLVCTAIEHVMEWSWTTKAKPPAVTRTDPRCPECNWQLHEHLPSGMFRCDRCDMLVRKDLARTS